MHVAPHSGSPAGRIDQAIEVPFPDEIGRAKLARFNGHGLEMREENVPVIVSKTKGASAAFI
ncbi:MAG TPA: hypothetical protein VM578_02875 [Candidatus Saccharimonadales bacterium]|nr:hypothetical protein [Candidatus Saccharimonadales bacterium]